MALKTDNIPSLPDPQIPKTTVRMSETEFTTRVTSYIQSMRNDGRFPASADIDGFFELVHNAVISRQEADGLAQQHRRLFLPDDPPSENEVDHIAITYMLKSRTPGQFDQGPAGRGRIKEVTGHQRYVTDHPDYPGEKLVTMGKFYSNWVTFCIYARKTSVALDNVLWFERLMDGFRWYFKMFGYEVIEEGVGPKDTVKVGDLELTKYEMSYFVRTCDTYHINTQELRSLVVDVGVSKQ
jgi:hypothetical protein